MAVTLAIDFGTKRMGIAITDSLGMIASPFATIAAKEIIEELKKIIEEKKVTTIVVGAPKKLSGLDSELTVMSDQFCKNLSRKFPTIKIERIDERFTSLMAQKSILESGHSKKKRQDKSMVDQVSAAIILQSWLDKKR